MIILATSFVSGPAKGLFQLMESVNKNIVEYHLFNFSAYGKTPDEFLSQAGTRGIRVRLFDQKNRSYISLVCQAGKIANAENFDIIQTHGFKPSMIGFFLKLLFRKKWICFMHGTTDENLKVRFFNTLDAIFQLFADRVVVVSESQRYKIPRGMKNKKIRVIRNAINAENPSPKSDKCATIRASYNLPGNVPLIAALGRLSPEKGFDILLEAAANLNKMNTNFHLVIVGEGQEERRLKILAESLNVDNLVTFAGFTATPGDFLDNATVVVLPSRSEGIPNVALEAMALGKPVVATMVGGVPEILQSEKTGLLVPPENPGTLTGALYRVLSDGVLAKKLGKNAKEYVCRHLTIEARTEKICRLYEELLPNIVKGKVR